MSIDLEAEYTNTNPADANYQNGSFKNAASPTSFDGTPYEKAWANDLWGLLSKILNDTGITPSGVPDTILASDYFDGLVKLFERAMVFVDTGSADDYELNSARGSAANPAAYYDGQPIVFKATNTNAGASTVEIGSLGAVDLTLDDGTALDPGNIVAGRYIVGIYRLSGTRVELISTAVNFPDQHNVDGTHKNIGIGVLPALWDSAYKAMQINTTGAISAISTEVAMTENAFRDSVDARWEYLTTSHASLYQQSGGEHGWQTAVSGTAGDEIIFTQIMRLRSPDSNSVLGLGISPADWDSLYDAFQINTTGAIAATTDQILMTENAVRDTTDNRWEYLTTSEASNYSQNGGTHVWQIAVSGTAGDEIVFTTVMQIDNTGAYFYSSLSSDTSDTAVSFDTSTKLFHYDSSATSLKQNITVMEDTSWIYDIPRKNFNGFRNRALKTKEDGTIKDRLRKEYGALAEDVEIINPDLVSYDEHGKLVSIRYNQLIIPTIQEAGILRQKVQDLTERLEKLENL